MPCLILPFPEELRPRLPTIVGNVDYRTLEDQLHRIDALLRHSEVERDFLQRSLDRWVGASRHRPSPAQQTRYQQRSQRALRCNLLRTLLQEDLRGFSIQLAGNPLYQWFCGIAAMDVVQVPSKSELQRFAHWLPAGELRALLDGLLRSATRTPERLQLEAPLDLDACFLDTTALKANIHFPTDWVLLRDAEGGIVGVRSRAKVRAFKRTQVPGNPDALECVCDWTFRVAHQPARRVNARRP